uniref:Tyrosinase copper-binding domain-containing protein n=1 Tax=Compsopogon caeruleus TaxID=31354 RepID=A0A7S1T768_9RHOD|mmetsp:Transcript_11626/g.23626  ORF Transcript_11626/g.23626 Transcript_11626/m.23626 type:complete len:291 (+) Transcript_11626:114-986(+)
MGWVQGVMPSGEIKRFGHSKNPNELTYFDLGEFLREKQRMGVSQRLEGASSICDLADRRIRREVGDLSQLEWDSYADAVLAAKNAVDSSGRNIIHQFAEFHDMFSNEAHGSPKFLCWHRWFIFYWESALRVFNPLVTLPYWDSARDAANPRGAQVFTETRAGSGENGTNVLNGKFKNWNVTFAQPHSVKRFLDESILVENSSKIDALLNNSSGTCEFMRLFEAIHGFVHLFVRRWSLPRALNLPRGEMTQIQVSPNDLVFFLHQYVVSTTWRKIEKLNKGVSQFIVSSWR